MSIAASVYDDLVGQEHIVDVLRKAVAATRSGDETLGITNQAMTHAWVFTGPPGSAAPVPPSPLHRPLCAPMMAAEYVTPAVAR